MAWTQGLAALVLVPMLATAWAVADEVRYFEKDGITYQETRRVVQRPVVETRLESREQTVYREQIKTELRDSSRTVQVPVTEYRLTMCMVDRWNPFVQPSYVYKYVPVTRWEVRQETVRTPITQRELIPEKRTVQVPVTTQRLAQDEVITRVAISAAAPRANATPLDPAPAVAGAATGQVGGVARMESDPPRRSTTAEPRPESRSRY